MISISTAAAAAKKRVNRPIMSAIPPANSMINAAQTQGSACPLRRHIAPYKTRDIAPVCLDLPAYPAIVLRSAPDEICGAKCCQYAVGGPHGKKANRGRGEAR